MAFYRTRSFLQRERIPVTIAVVAACAILFVANFFFPSILLLAAYYVDHGHLISGLWTPLSYPFLNLSIISLLFALMSIWWVGGSLERSWGSMRFGCFFLGVTLLSAALVWIGSLVLRSSGDLVSLWPPIAVLTAAWASINPNEQVTFNFIFKVASRWLAVIIVAWTYFSSFAEHPFVGLFWLLCPVAAWYYVRMGLSVGRPVFRRRPAPRGPDLRFSTSQPPRENAGGRRGPFAWYRSWQERRHLEKLWKNSGFSDKDDQNRR